MALLRVVPYGQPVMPEHLIDLGPAHAQLTRDGIYGGPIQYGPSRPAYERAKLDSAIERERRTIALAVTRCGQVLRGGEHCGRRAGHGDYHKSPAAVQRDNARRRARHAP